MNLQAGPPGQDLEAPSPGHCPADVPVNAADSSWLTRFHTMG